MTLFAIVKAKCVSLFELPQRMPHQKLKPAGLVSKQVAVIGKRPQMSLWSADAPAEAADGGDEGAKEKKPKAKRKSEGGGEKAAKRSRALKVDGTAKKPSPFTRPLKVSPELSEWLGGQTEISRPELTKRFWAYAKVQSGG